MLEKPKKIRPELKPFWGGYYLEFKLISKKLFEQFGRDPEKARRNALTLENSTKFAVDISKFEFVGAHRVLREVDGVYFYVYAPELIVFKKYVRWRKKYRNTR